MALRGALPEGVVEKSPQTEGVQEQTDRTVFIGHGRSALWRELKDFLVERLGLGWDECNRESLHLENPEHCGE